MKTRLLVGAAVLALATTLTACTDSAETTSSGSASSADGTIASQLIMGGPPEFKTRADGLPGLEKNYGVVFGNYTVTDTGGPVTVNALKNGQIDAADLFTTDPSIKANDFVVLTDPENNFAAQNVLPIITKDLATDGVTSTLNAVSAKLTTEGLIDMLTKVQEEKQDASAVATQWLADNGLDAAGTQAQGVTLTVGSANFPENVVLAEIYAQALRAQGAEVSTQLNIGSREKYYPALEAGSINLMPEYSGTILSYLDPNATAVDSEEVYTALTEALPDGLTVLAQSQAQDADAIVVTRETAETYGLTSIADLAKPAP